MSDTVFLGARVEDDILAMVDQTAAEEHVDKTKALKRLITLGRKKLLLDKALEQYRKGFCSLDKAAKMAHVCVSEMMHEAANAGITSTETIEEYKKGIVLLQ